MTQLRTTPGLARWLSNYFDELTRGLGHRGSSFSDIDAATHDRATDRLLFQEFKRPGQCIPAGQKQLLAAIARLPNCAVWCVRQRQDGDLDWYDMAEQHMETIPEEEYSSRFKRWWDQQPIVIARLPVRPDNGEVSFAPVCPVCDGSLTLRPFDLFVATEVCEQQDALCTPCKDQAIKLGIL